MTNKLMINTCRRNDITQCWSSAGFNIALKREGGKRKKKKEEKKTEVITTRGIRIWSPIQVLAPLNRA